MLNGKMHIGCSVITAHAAGELVADSNPTAADQVRAINRDCTLLQSRRSHQRLPGRSRGIFPLDCPIDQRLVRIVQQLLVLGPAFFGSDPLREEIGIKRGSRSHGQNFTVVGIHGNDHTPSLWGFAQLVFSGLLQIKIDGSHNVLARLRLDPFNFVLNMAATINDYFPEAVSAAQVFVIDGL